MADQDPFRGSPSIPYRDSLVSPSHPSEPTVRQPFDSSSPGFPNFSQPPPLTAARDRGTSVEVRPDLAPNVFAQPNRRKPGRQGFVEAIPVAQAEPVAWPQSKDSEPARAPSAQDGLGANKQPQPGPNFSQGQASTPHSNPPQQARSGAEQSATSSYHTSSPGGSSPSLRASTSPTPSRGPPPPPASANVAEVRPLTKAASVWGLDDDVVAGWFAFVDVNGDGLVEAPDAANFLRRSGLSTTTLAWVWEHAAIRRTRQLNPWEFGLALRSLTNQHPAVSAASSRPQMRVRGGSAL
ncbi:hypothetical protein CYMTET_50882 [Cymbomonas tetramitiformis]|uniref:EF-hand domain-containing protein n=1 Tax=Cymbomonas tetramitiformis TaxID=36881 RepID=A0AAE0BM66_9CHLO|nr:hypothetical protein CYMTET_50882 [Cymbomonas tetramitiformis]